MAVVLCCAASLLAAQPDPLRDCRRQASVATGAAVSEIDARVFQFLILWSASEGGRTANGYCEAGKAGQIVHFEMSPHGWTRGDGSVPKADFAQDCRMQASISTGMEAAAIEVRRNLDWILWQVKAGIERIEGFCQADSRSGRIVRFVANRPEVEDPISHDDAEGTCRRAARRKVGAGDEDVEAAFERAEGTNSYRIQWRTAGKTGWCVIDSMTGRLRKVETADGR